MFTYKTFESNTPAEGYWDMAMLEDFKNYKYLKFVDSPIKKIIVIPARQNVFRINEVNKYLNQFQGVVLILTGDEENSFPTEKINHPNIKIWLMTPSRNHTNVDRFLPNGYSPHTRLLSKYKKKDLDWFFAGQITHAEREKLAETLKTLDNGKFLGSQGFTQGYPQEEYIKELSRAKVVPCPSGAVMADSFRFYEALEAGCVPLVLEKNLEYYYKLFGENPIRGLDDWENFGNYVNWFIDTYPYYNNVMSAWWTQEKKKIIKNLADDFEAIGGTVIKNDILVLVTTSPTKIHPSIKHIETTIKSVADRLPNSEILVLADGIRSEQMKFTEKYFEYLRRLIQLKWKYPQISFKLHETHNHQTGMLKGVINDIWQKKILFVEHDAPLCEEIPFEELETVIDDGYANFIRLNHEALILDVHKHLMLNKVVINDVPLVETAQWSQRPHLASTDFYRKILGNFTENSKSMIEDKMFGVVAEAFFKRGRAGWNDYKLMIYAPDGDMKRSYHLDSRGNEPKFEMIF